MAYETVDSRVVYDGLRTRVRIDRVRMPDGDVSEREIVEQAGAVAVVAVDDESQVVLVRQYRHAIGGYALELPAGKLDVDGEAPADAARRELREEAGVDVASLEELITFDNSAGWATESTTIYLGTGVHQASEDGFTASAEEADIDITRLPLREAAAMAAEGRLRDAKTVIGLLIAARRLGGTTTT